MSCSKRWQDALLDAAYGQLSGSDLEAFERHVAGCEICARELSELRATLTSIKTRLPERPAPGELNAWSQVAPRLAAQSKTDRRRRRLTLGLPLAAAAAVALVALGIGLGRWLAPAPGPAPSPRVAEAPTPAATLPATAQYAQFLERSTPLLLAVANRQNGRAMTQLVSFDPQTEKRVAADLAAEAQRLSEQLTEAGRGREAKLVDNLGIVFLQMANLPERDYTEKLDLVQATIQQRAILFQLTVEEMRRTDDNKDIPLG